MPLGRSKTDELPPLEIESLDDEPVDGVTVVSGPRGPIPWGLVAVIAAGLLLFVVVSGLGSHAPKADQPDEAGAPVPTFVSSPAPPPDERSPAFVRGPLAATIRMSEVDASTNLVRFTFKGGGGAPARWYYLQIGVCPAKKPSVELGTPAGFDGTFEANVDSHVLPGAPLWIRVLDSGGTEFGTAYGRLFQTEFMLLREGSDAC